MRIIVAGDFCPQHRVAESFEKEDFAAVLGEVKPVIEQADYSIVNFECPITKGGEKPIEKIGPNLQCSKRGVEAVKWVGFDCVTLANNHFYDFGEVGVANTLNACQEYGIDTVGGGLDLHEASKILYKEIEGKTLAVINCCEHEFSIATDKTGGSNPLNPIQQYYAIKEAREKADFVLVIVHGGHEMYQLPSPRMQEIYRFFIDAGADAVVNHHQHCISGYEVYNNKPIFYGLGNMCFDHPAYRDSIWNEGFMLSLSFSDTVTFKLFPYSQCNTITSIQFCNENTYFFQKLNKLNKAISESAELQFEFEKECREKSKMYQRLLKPYPINRYFIKMDTWGILPSFISKRKSLMFFNYVFCESHFERFKQMLININLK